MATDEVKVQVDSGARTVLVRAKIKEMRDRGYQLVGPEPELPAAEDSRVSAEMILVFHHPNFVKVEGSGFSGPSASVVIEGGTFENRSSGAGLSAGPL